LREYNSDVCRYTISSFDLYNITGDKLNEIRQLEKKRITLAASILTNCPSLRHLVCGGTKFLKASIMDSDFEV